MFPVKFTTLLLGLFLAITTHAQDRTCYDHLRKLGLYDYYDGKYSSAIRHWKAAKGCKYIPKENDLEEWIEKAELLAPPTYNDALDIPMVLVEGGTFVINRNEGLPPQSVSVNSFYIGKFELTQAQWRSVMGDMPKRLLHQNCDECPVENVSWAEVQRFIEILNATSDKKYRLPTEAEWEYAARGGRNSRDYTYAGSNNLQEVAWYTWNSEGTTHPVGQRQANELGIHDMNGNVWEWVQNCWNASHLSAIVSAAYRTGDCSHRTLRGGAWVSIEMDCQINTRHAETPNTYNDYIGFRLAMDTE